MKIDNKIHVRKNYFLKRKHHLLKHKFDKIIKKNNAKMFKVFKLKAFLFLKKIGKVKLRKFQQKYKNRQ